MDRFGKRKYIMIILLVGMSSLINAQNYIFKCDGIYQTNNKGIKIFLDKKHSSVSPIDSIGARLKDNPNSIVKRDTKTPDSYLVDTIPIVCFHDFKKVRLDKDKDTNGQTLYIELKDNVKAKFAYATDKNISKPLLFIFENRLISAPIVVSSIESGEITVTGLDEEIIKTIIKKVNK